ncbi:MAG: GNAT family N-acetyltransferase [Deltaproteobacteria bacterium]|nr:GNAT family N-acetyltransferase [Deltaproteobacteria bacterium]MCW5802091.1 GNAT family N-acetyltransferase [Deltaproteobacteria bacterium]
MDVKQLGPDALEAARMLLRASDLPADDLPDPAIRLLGAFDGDELLGVVGLQTCDATGLLRSLAVRPVARDRGIARALCERVFALADGQGLDGLWLLTTSASAYFTRHGFRAVDRNTAPLAIRETAQFASLCPSTAIVMRRKG